MSATAVPRTAKAAPRAAEPEASREATTSAPVRTPRRSHTEKRSQGRTPASRAAPKAVAATANGATQARVWSTETVNGPVETSAATPRASPV
ncbi:MAG TPA: hypothetical protein VKZ65_14405 [Glycomyces sp.]|nr:hypothetical protein [Glycomyces sp.]